MTFSGTRPCDWQLFQPRQAGILQTPPKRVQTSGNHNMPSEICK